VKTQPSEKDRLQAVVFTETAVLFATKVGQKSSMRNAEGIIPHRLSSVCRSRGVSPPASDSKKKPSASTQPPGPPNGSVGFVLSKDRMYDSQLRCPSAEVRHRFEVFAVQLFGWPIPQEHM
jgi:hypothetical protein